MSDFDVDAFIEYHVGDCSCEHGHECQSCTMKHELKKEIKELRTRVADWRADAVKHAQEVLELRARLSTLLKASEGMEKALEYIFFCEAEYDERVSMMKKTGIKPHGNWVKDAKQALADFRALKEMK